MKTRHAALLLSLLLVLAPSSSSRAEIDEIAALPKVTIDGIIAVLAHDWDGDGREDRAILARVDGGDIDLFILLSSGGYERASDIAFGGGMMPLPFLSLNNAGSLVVSSSNPAVGRNRWEREIVIAYRGGRFLVAGYEYRSHDTLGHDPNVSYQANYLTGVKILNAETTKEAPQTIPLAEWVTPESIW